MSKITGNGYSEGKVQVSGLGQCTGLDQYTKVGFTFPPTLDNPSCTYKTLVFIGDGIRMRRKFGV